MAVDASWLDACVRLADESTDAKSPCVSAGTLAWRLRRGFNPETEHLATAVPYSSVGSQFSALATISGVHYTPAGRSRARWAQLAGGGSFNPQHLNV